MATQADVSAITYFAPILAFLIVFAIIYMLLRKTKPFGEGHAWIDIFISFAVATVFVTAGSVRQIVLDVTPWFALLIIAMFFMFVITGFLGKSADGIMGKRMGWIFVIFLMFIFLFSGIKVFAHVLAPYLPGPYFGATGEPEVLFFLSWLYSPPVVGAILLIIVAALVSWVLVKNTK